MIEIKITVWDPRMDESRGPSCSTAEVAIDAKTATTNQYSNLKDNVLSAASVAKLLSDVREQAGLPH